MAAARAKRARACGKRRARAQRRASSRAISRFELLELGGDHVMIGELLLGLLRECLHPAQIAGRPRFLQPDAVHRHHVLARRIERNPRVVLRHDRVLDRMPAALVEVAIVRRARLPAFVQQRVELQDHDLRRDGPGGAAREGERDRLRRVRIDPHLMERADHARAEMHRRIDGLRDAGEARRGFLDRVDEQVQPENGRAEIGRRDAKLDGKETGSCHGDSSTKRFERWRCKAAPLTAGFRAWRFPPSARSARPRFRHGFPAAAAHRH